MAVKSNTTKPRKKPKKVNRSLVPSRITKIFTYPAIQAKIVINTKNKQEEHCAFQWCNNILGPTAVGGVYCCNTCLAYDRQRLLKAIKAQKGNESNYRPEYANQIFFKYIQQCELSHNPFIVQEGTNLLPIKRLQVPMVEGYAAYIGVPRKQLRRWASMYPEFYEAMKQLKDLQKMYLINNGLSGNYNPMITKVMLMNNHNMVDKSENTNNNTNLIGIVKDVYAYADKYSSQKMIDDPVPEDKEDDKLVWHQKKTLTQNV